MGSPPHHRLALEIFCGLRKAPVSAAPYTLPLFPLHCKNQNPPPLPSSAAVPSASTMVDPPHDQERAGKQSFVSVVVDS
eukprot:scaffold78169_cov50-Cyclotella_meneghiniana.AAC.6